MLKFYKYIIPFIVILMSFGSAHIVRAESTKVTTHVRINANESVQYDYPQSPREMNRVSPKVRHAEDFEARELKLQIRELASQLLETYSNEALVGSIAIPTSFTNLDDFGLTSPLGRYFSEALMYEFNVRAFPVLEYRLDNAITINAQGELVLSRNLPEFKYGLENRNDVLLVGTYYVDDLAVFVNARLVKPNGLVLRTAQMVLPMTGLLSRMTTLPPEPEAAPMPALASGALKVRRK